MKLDAILKKFIQQPHNQNKPQAQVPIAMNFLHTTRKQIPISLIDFKAAGFQEKTNRCFLV